jgi:hypothetical protein
MMISFLPLMSPCFLIQKAIKLQGKGKQPTEQFTKEI